jgi:predicted phosphodiesterase
MYQRTAIITDIHGNLEGLEAVWRDVDDTGCDRIVCLGDLVDGGRYDNEVARFIRDRGVPCVRGNHDENETLELDDDVRQYLASLPDSLVEDGGIVYTHISPRERRNKIIDVYEAWNVFDDCAARRIFVGHAHIPMIFGERSPHSASAAEHSFAYNEPFGLDPSDRYIVCVGAVGYPRDGIRNPRYAIFDEVSSSIEMRFVEGVVLPYG